MIEFIKTYSNDIFTIIGYLVSIASIIVKLTPSSKDDAVLNNIIAIIAKFSIFNTKEDQKKIDGTSEEENKEKE